MVASPSMQRPCRLKRSVVLGACLVALLAPGLVPGARAQSQTGPAHPEAASGYALQPVVRARRQMVATANPHASRAALEVLRSGGSAIDAAIAAQMVLTLTEPQSSGIGGGAFLLYFDAKQRQVQAWDGRETAPAAADARWFLDASGAPLRFVDAMVGGRSVGVPGVVRMLEAAHRQHGRLPWVRLFEPAKALAQAGFEVSPRLHRLLALDPHLRQDPAASAYFYSPQGEPWPIGHRLRNPVLADTLDQIARRGSLALHSGPIARDMVDAVRHHPTRPGQMSEHDLAFYQPRLRQALCAPLRLGGAALRLCGMPPPSSGGMAVLQILRLMQAAGSPALADSVQTDPARIVQAPGLHVFTEASRLAFADRDRYLADPDHVEIPAGLTDPGYLQARATLIGERSMKTALPGTPPGWRQARGAGETLERSATTHLSIVDAWGNAVSMTSSIENAFGARLMVRGFLLNNQLTDFSFAPERDGLPIANRVEPGKRPRSSMAPTIVLSADGQLRMTLGSPGGAQIIGYVARTLWMTLHDGLGLQQAIALPNFGSRNGPTELETGIGLDAQAAALVARGHEVRRIEMTSGLQGIVRQCDAGGCTLEGGADPRREGLVLGD
jgi:gamma-glutamyltranspeptidase/glutathione hydrolase